MDEWEDILTNDVYDIEEMVEDFIQPLATPQHAKPMSLNNEQTYEQSNSPIEPVGHSAGPSSEMSEEGQGNAQQVAETSENTSESNSVVSGSDKAEQNANEQQDSPSVLNEMKPEAKASS